MKLLANIIKIGSPTTIKLMPKQYDVLDKIYMTPERKSLLDIIKKYNLEGYLGLTEKPFEQLKAEAKNILFWEKCFYNVEMVPNNTNGHFSLILKAKKYEPVYILGRSMKEWKAAVNNNSYNLFNIRNPPESLQLVAVKQNTRALLKIDKPSNKLQIAACRKNGNSVKYINNKICNRAQVLAAETMNKENFIYLTYPKAMEIFCKRMVVERVMNE